MREHAHDFTLCTELRCRNHIPKKRSIYARIKPYALVVSVNRYALAFENGLSSSVKRYGSVIGKDVHPHTFRHSYAIHCVRNGWDIRRLQQVLGHSSLNVTAVYLQFNDQDVKELYDKTPF